MRGRRGSRSAALVLAGCVGLAVMAPGLALAATPPATDADCATLIGTGSVLDPASSTGCTPATSSGGSSAASGTGSAGTGGASSGSTSSAGSSSSSSSASSGSSSSTTQGTSPASTTDPQNSDGAAASSPTGSAGTATARPVSPAAATDGGQQLVSQLAAITLPNGLTLPDNFTPGAGSLTGLLGNLPAVTTVPTGGFTNPQQACAFFAGGLPIQGTPAQLQTLGTAFSQFCSSLPTSFGGLDLNTLLGFLKQLVSKIPTPGTGSGTIPAQAPSTVPAQYWGYWQRHYDVDCPELTYEEANAILAGDPSDPFRLDGDHDGVACEDNAHGDDVAYADYASYPTGGVATGDGSTGTGAPGVEVALAAAVLGGLGLSGLVLVRRFARQG